MFSQQRPILYKVGENQLMDTRSLLFPGLGRFDKLKIFKLEKFKKKIYLSKIYSGSHQLCVNKIFFFTLFKKFNLFDANYFIQLVLCQIRESAHTHFNCPSVRSSRKPLLTFHHEVCHSLDRRFRRWRALFLRILSHRLLHCQPDPLLLENLGQAPRGSPGGCQPSHLRILLCLLQLHLLHRPGHLRGSALEDSGRKEDDL